METHGLSSKEARAETSKRRRAKRRQNAGTLRLSRATANDPMRSKTALDAESNEAHDRAKAKKNDRDRRTANLPIHGDQYKEYVAAGQANLQQGDGVPDWASKEFAEQTLEKGPVEGSEPRGSEPADETYESSASKEGITAMGPGASSQAVTRSTDSILDMDRKNEIREMKNQKMKERWWIPSLALPPHTGRKTKSIRELEGTGPGSRPLENKKLKAYDPESTSLGSHASQSVEARQLSDQRAFKSNKNQARERHRRPEEPLSMRPRPMQGPARKPSMLQKFKNLFKRDTQ